MTHPRTRAQIILDTAETSGICFAWDDRKEDEDLPRGAIEEAIAAGEVTIDEIAEAFKTGIRGAVDVPVAG